MERSVIHQFIQSAEVYPGNTALVARQRTFTYTELSAISESIRLALIAQGITGARRIGVMTGDGVATYAAILAVLANGCAYVPINSKNPAAHNIEVIKEAGITALLYETPCALTSRAPEEYDAECKLIQVTTDAAMPTAPLRLEWVEEPPLAYLLFTSGSTGQPKGVPISHANLNHFMSVMLEHGIYDFGSDDRFLQMFELTFDLSVMSLFVPLSIGASCHVVPDSKIGAAAVLNTMQRDKVTVALMVPSLLLFLEPYLGRTKLPDLRLSLFCGEALPDSLVQKWHRTAANSSIENVYGPTEATIFCLRYPWDPDHSPEAAVNGVVPIGKPLPGTGALLVDEHDNIVRESGIKGQLALTGPQLSAGYWQRPDKTTEAYTIIDGQNGSLIAYRTGDLCSTDGDGDFIYHGRLDSQVKIDGHRVELGEIEHHVRQILGRANLAVVAVDKGGRTIPVLFLEKPEINLPNLVTELKSRIPGYMAPARCCYVEKLPLNLNGKVDRRKLSRIISDPQPSS